MGMTPTRAVRVEPELEAAARAHKGLADVSTSTLIRVALGVLGDLEDLGMPVGKLVAQYGDRSHAHKKEGAG